MNDDLIYEARCHIDPDDRLEVSVDRADGSVYLVAQRGSSGEDASVFLTPRKARKLAKAIKRAARLVEDEED